MMARQIMHPQSLALCVLMCAWCALPLSSAAAQTTSTTTQSTTPNADNLPLPAAGVPPVGSTTAVPAAAATPAATASKKIPLAPPDVFEPAAEVASALPVPIPETFPSAAGLGFDGAGYGGQTVPGGGLGGFNGGQGGFGSNGGFGGCCGGFGSNGFGYNNGQLFFNSAPAESLRLRSMAAANVLTPLLLACVFVIFCV